MSKEKNKIHVARHIDLLQESSNIVPTLARLDNKCPGELEECYCVRVTGVVLLLPACCRVSVDEGDAGASRAGQSAPMLGAQKPLLLLLQPVATGEIQSNTVCVVQFQSALVPQIETVQAIWKACLSLRIRFHYCAYGRHISKAIKTRRVEENVLFPFELATV
ncbi:hypothetical protein ABVT39_007035, partial [Epinephelus coioides]